MRAKPPPLVAVIDRTPAKEAPIAMLMAAISSSACLTTIPRLWACAASQWRTPEAGVIGYWARNLQPAAAAPRAIAWLPVIRSLGAPPLRTAEAFALAWVSAK